MQEWILTYLLLPALIILARIVDVSIGTIRVIFISKGFRKWAPVLGFFEVLVWLLVIKHIITDMHHWSGYIAYASGFALGTYIGMLLEEKLIHDKVVLRFIIRQQPQRLLDELEEHWRVTVSDGKGSKGPVKILFMVIPRDEVHKVIDIVKNYNPKAFYSMEPVKYAREPVELNVSKRKNVFSYLALRKGK